MDNLTSRHGSNILNSDFKDKVILVLLWFYTFSVKYHIIDYPEIAFVWFSPFCG